jgi:hypothetical protein
VANVCRLVEGWEHGVTPVTAGGGLASGITGTPTVGSSFARKSSFGLQANPAASVDESWNSPAWTGQAVQAISIYVKPVTLDTGSVYNVIGLSNSAAFTQYAVVGVNTSNQWMFNWTGAAAVATGPALVLNRWTLIELMLDMRANPWAARWRIDGVEQPTPTTLAQAISSGGCVACGAFAPTVRTVEYQFDDLVAVDGTDQSMWPLGGFDIRGITVDQTVASDHQGTLTGWSYTDNDFTGSTAIASGAETVSRSRIDDLGGIDGVQQNNVTPGGSLRYPIADPPQLGVPRAVSLYTASKESATGVNNATFRTLVSGSTTNHFTGDPGWGTTLSYLMSCMDTRPAGGAWTLTDVNGINFEFLSTDGSPNPRLMGVVYEVAFPDIYVPRPVVLSTAAVKRASTR